MPRVAGLRRSFPTPVSLFRWLGKTRRRVWCVVLVLLVVVLGPPIWWNFQLMGLPDVGDPFDVAAFQKYTIPDDRNAFVLYGEAARLLKPRARFVKTSRGNADPAIRWSKTNRDIQQWVEANHDALAVYRRGAERRDALEVPVVTDRDSYTPWQGLLVFRLMGMLEASRLEEEGDMAGAWEWYGALLRTSHHIGMRSVPHKRSFAQNWQRPFADRVKLWAASPRTTPALLRRALDDVVACESLAPVEADSLKIGYIGAMGLLDTPENPGRDAPVATFRRFWNPNYQLAPEQIQSLWDWWRYWRREPERSRRVIRLVTANWLAYHELPAGRRPKPDPAVAGLDLYSFGREAPAQARALSPDSLDRWFDSAYDAQQIMQYINSSGVRARERANYLEILMLLATEQYRRDHGRDPDTPEALVGRYLKTLPVELQTDDKDNASADGSAP